MANICIRVKILRTGVRAHHYNPGSASHRGAGHTVPLPSA